MNTNDKEIHLDLITKLSGNNECIVSGKSGN